MKLQAFSLSIAYSLTDGWEVNTTVRVKGFKQDKENETYIAKFSYSIDLVTPKGETIKAFPAIRLMRRTWKNF